jgi:hypothetical protein
MSFKCRTEGCIAPLLPLVVTSERLCTRRDVYGRMAEQIFGRRQGSKSFAKSDPPSASRTIRSFPSCPRAENQLKTNRAFLLPTCIFRVREQAAWSSQEDRVAGTHLIRVDVHQSCKTTVRLHSSRYIPQDSLAHSQVEWIFGSLLSAEVE